VNTVLADEVLTLFLELAAVPSPSGQETAVAEQVRRYLRDLGLRVEEDEAGNLLARIEPTEEGGTPIFLCSHMDTVPPKGQIEPVVDDGFVRSAGDTILGADNKAAVAVMLEAARLVLAEGRQHAGVELLFTTREEVGLEGAKEFDPARLRPAGLGFVYDYSGSIGDVVVAAPWARTLDVVFAGRPAHSGINPEEGRSAVAAAARAIADLRLGRIDEETTANVGRIEGGSARNVVPARCTLAAEARSRDRRKLTDVVQEMLDCFAFAAAVAECEVETTVEDKYEGYRLTPDEPALLLAKKALERAGFAPREVEVGGGSDANVFNTTGVPCVNLANGMSKVHTSEEEIAVADLGAMVRVTLELLDAARAAEP
jgi:tripeptide aminopeptidase